MFTKFGEFTLKFNELVGQLGAHTAHVTQNWLRSNCSEFVNKDEWLPNLPILKLK